MQKYVVVWESLQPSKRFVANSPYRLSSIAAFAENTSFLPNYAPLLVIIRRKNGSNILFDENSSFLSNYMRLLTKIHFTFEPIMAYIVICRTFALSSLPNLSNNKRVCSYIELISVETNNLSCTRLHFNYSIFVVTDIRGKYSYCDQPLWAAYWFIRY